MDWPHAPKHWLLTGGVYMVTAGTYRKEHHFRSEERRDELQQKLFDLVDRFGWELKAWAILSNHYHFIASHSESGQSLRPLISRLHMTTAKSVNRADGTPGRKVWFQYWDAKITYSKSYLARLHYVHANPVHHGLVKRATSYPWCSAAWFVRSAPKSFVNSVRMMKVDQLQIPDDY